jgi:microcompartment protein CcmK/EutM
MFVGRVIGTVWSTVKWPQLAGHKLLVVQPYHLADLLQHPKTLSPAAAAAIPDGPPESAAHEAVVCVDLLDAGVGDDVVVAFGHAARVAAQPGQADVASTPTGQTPPASVTPIDAAIVAIVDGFGLSSG